MDPYAMALTQRIARHLSDKRAEDILALDVSRLTIIADTMVIASARSALAVRALYDSLTETLEEDGIAPRRKEGAAEGRWIVADFGHVILHLFHEQERAYYNLERLWSDGSNKIELDLS
ncbi:MAG: ribosome silencing factor [Oscillospiraceae bacterium]|jgi:ribosome-associated protein|nr:ribosome silencing factor [Oscillospiraceae bacterium]